MLRSRLVVTVLAVFALIAPVPVAAPASATSAGYTWRNVQIGGGGLVPGIVFSRKEHGLIYARTDISGAYRWDGRWVPLLDWVGWDEWGHNGVASLAADPVVTDKENTVYRSTDDGVSWERIPGQPTGYIAHKGVVEGDALYIATSDTAEPYDGGKRDVWKFDSRTSAWTNISPVPSSSSDAHFGYSSLTVDRQNPNTLMVATQISPPEGPPLASGLGDIGGFRHDDLTKIPSMMFLSAGFHQHHQPGLRRGQSVRHGARG